MGWEKQYGVLYWRSILIGALSYPASKFPTALSAGRPKTNCFGAYALSALAMKSKRPGSAAYAMRTRLAAAWARSRVAATTNATGLPEWPVPGLARRGPAGQYVTRLGS